MIPAHTTNIGKINGALLKTGAILAMSAALSMAPMLIAATRLTISESNKSAPIPAVSPTLSPTLSAITAGLRGSSSGIPASTLPTKSAPISAAFV